MLFMPFILLLALLPLQPLPAHAELIQIQILHRHGARPPLIKHAYNTSIEDRHRNRARLFPIGIDQIRALGTYVNETYIKGSDKITNLSAPLIRQVNSRTSNTVRTIQSAQAFLSGLDPGKIYFTRVFGTARNDWVIRGYAICPELVRRFKDFVNGDQLRKKKEQDGNGKFVENLAKRLEDQKADFTEVFNIYDKYLEIRKKGFGRPRFSPEASPLSDQEFERLEGLADWYESTKFSFGEHKIHVAAGLLADILKGMEAFVNRRTSRPPPFRIVHYSAHYPTLLSLWASLRAGNSDDEPKPPADKIPRFGAALIFELHKEGDDYFVRMRWFNGGLEKDEKIVPGDFRPVAIGRGACSEENKEQGCKYSDFKNLLSGINRERKEFCEMCKATAPVCRDPRFGASNRGKVTAGFVGGIIGLCAGTALALSYTMCSARRKRQNMRLHQNGFDNEHDMNGGAVYP